MREVLETKLSLKDLGLYKQGKLVEKYADPKKVLHEVVRKTHPRKLHSWARVARELYEQLATEIRLEKLEQVPACRQFKDDLTTLLKDLRFLP
jgi:hypothetical protein